jgi:hypothetical protein
VHTLQQPYRDLCDALYDYERADFYEDLVTPWLRQHDSERRGLEILRHRCFVRCTKPDGDLWLFDYTHSEAL